VLRLLLHARSSRLMFSRLHNERTKGRQIKGQLADIVTQ
jgi:hypothetical protein